MLSQLAACATALFGGIAVVRSARGQHLLRWGGQQLGRWFDGALYASLVLLTVRALPDHASGWWIAWVACLVVGSVIGLTRTDPSGPESDDPS